MTMTVSGLSADHILSTHWSTATDVFFTCVT
jgi:hypothetical protein